MQLLVSSRGTVGLSTLFITAPPKAGAGAVPDADLLLSVQQGMLELMPLLWRSCLGGQLPDPEMAVMVRRGKPSTSAMCLLYDAHGQGCMGDGRKEHGLTRRIEICVSAVMVSVA